MTKIRGSIRMAWTLALILGGLTSTVQAFAWKSKARRLARRTQVERLRDAMAESDARYSRSPAVQYGRLSTTLEQEFKRFWGEFKGTVRRRDFVNSAAMADFFDQLYGERFSFTQILDVFPPGSDYEGNARADYRWQRAAPAPQVVQVFQAPASSGLFGVDRASSYPANPYYVPAVNYPSSRDRSSALAALAEEAQFQSLPASSNTWASGERMDDSSSYWDNLAQQGSDLWSSTGLNQAFPIPALVDTFSSIGEAATSGQYSRVIRPGESLSGIAESLRQEHGLQAPIYGQGGILEALQNANSEAISDPNNIVAGGTLYLPVGALPNAAPQTQGPPY